MGYEAERNSGLLYANARFFDTELGTFLTHDPAAQFWNPYTYVGWDPVNGTDPTGELADWAVYAIIGAVIGFAVGTIQAAINGASFGEALLSGLVSGYPFGDTRIDVGPGRPQNLHRGGVGDAEQAGGVAEAGGGVAAKRTDGSAIR